MGGEPAGRTVVRALVEKTPEVVPGERWKVHYLFFARAGFTAAAQKEAGKVDAILVDLETLDEDLKRTEEEPRYMIDTMLVECTCPFLATIKGI
jgi:hypothetical protein